MSHGLRNGRKGYLHSLASNLCPTLYLKKEEEKITLSFQRWNERTLHELVAMLSARRSLVRNYQRKTLFLLVVSRSTSPVSTIERLYIREMMANPKTLGLDGVRNVEAFLSSTRSPRYAAICIPRLRFMDVKDVSPLSTIKSQRTARTTHTINEDIFAHRLCIPCPIVLFNTEINPRPFSDLRKPLLFLLFFANSSNLIVNRHVFKLSISLSLSTFRESKLN